MDVCKSQTFTDKEGLRLEGFLERVERPLKTTNSVRIRLFGRRGG